MVTLSSSSSFKVEEVSADRTVTGRLVSTGLRPTFLDKFERHGIRCPSSCSSNSRAVAPDYLRSVEA